MPSTQLAIIAGVGPGTGASVARRFASKYTVVLLARNPDGLQAVEQGVTQNGGKALSISTDVSNPESVKQAFSKIAQAFPDATCAAAVFNATGPFVRKSLLELTVEEFDRGYSVSMRGAFLFSQHVLPLLLKHAESSNDGSEDLPPTLIFTGATASVKANALMSAFAAPKFGVRALSQSIAREFGPKGVHVAHANIDGAIDIPQHQHFLKDMAEMAKINPEDIAETYWNLHAQSKRCFTNEIDVRPMLEKW